MSDDPLDPVFEALAHPVRRAVLDIVKRMPGASVADIAREFPISRIAVMKHLALLEAAELLTSEKRGRIRHHWINTVPLQRIVDRWQDEFGAFWSTQVVDLKRRLEESQAPCPPPTSPPKATPPTSRSTGSRSAPRPRRSGTRS
ncbi:MAG: helix-turn-helix transcriptional regulator [Planctomycetes bacterium]|nr:helix-turn-helix transcriptional regulator [Planctomycetota bacterium]MCB9829247.1 helix-turn-helix transcriptional regulator [Planctomycetota bacterium]MCB9902595.1 helix-turn-helix transcriptional regulator [Planctomycetota bacterium]